MSWHDRTCENINLNWFDGVPSCDTCGSSASSVLTHTIAAPPPPPPPKGLKRSQLKLSWPPCVKYFGPVIDEGGNNVAAFLIDDVDRWENPVSGRLGPESHEGPATKLAGEGLGDDNGEDRPSGEIGLDDAPSGNNNTAEDPQTRHLELALEGIHKDLLKPDGIRLLRLYGAESFQEPVHCSLEVTQLDDPMLSTYEALSYTWADLDGDKRNCSPVFIGPQYRVLLVTRNCQSALRRLRTRHDRVLWVDSICINQYDFLERQFQVGIMADIYSTAARVLVYLGEARNGSEAAMKAVAARSTSNESDKEALVQLFQRPYFRRIWVIQEIALARKASVTCGNDTAHWTSLCSAFQSCELDSSWINHFSLPKHNKQKPPELLQLLIDTRDSRCADPRDRVYGLIGLVHPDEAKRLPVDYSLSVQQLYTGLAVYWALQPKGSPCFDFLSFASVETKIAGLPSWVPDWTNLAVCQVVSLRMTFHVTETLSGDDGSLEKAYFQQEFNESHTLDLAYYEIWKPPESLITPLDDGSLVVYGSPLFRYSQGTLTFAGRHMNGLRIDRLKFDGHPRLLDDERDLEMYYFPKWRKALVLRRDADSNFSVEGNLSIVLSSSDRRRSKGKDDKTNPGIRVINSAGDPINRQEEDRIFWWSVDTMFLEERLSRNFHAGSEDERTTTWFFKPVFSNLADAIRSAIKTGPPANANQPPVESAHIASMEQMRTEMLQSLAPQDVEKFQKRAEFNPLDLPDPVRYRNWKPQIGVFKKEFCEAVSEWTRLDESPEDQVVSWRQEVTRLEKVLARGSFAETLRELPSDLCPRWTLAPVSPYNLVEQAHVFCMALHHMETSSLDHKKSWEWNRDRFWTCLKSFDLITRLREFLYNRQVLFLIKSSIVDGALERVTLV